MLEKEFVCADCGRVCERTAAGFVHLDEPACAELEADLVSGWRKVLCGVCLVGGPVVVKVVSAAPAVSMREALEEIAGGSESESGSDKENQVLSLMLACAEEDMVLDVRSRSGREEARDKLLARGWTCVERPGCALGVFWVRPERDAEGLES